MQPKHFTLLASLSLAISWIFDQLFWEKATGLSFPIFIILILACGFGLTWAEGKRPPLASLLLAVGAIFFSVFVFLRLEPMTVFVSVCLSLGCLLLLSISWLGGGWVRYDLQDYPVNFLRWLGGLFTETGKQFAERREPVQAEGDQTIGKLARKSRSAWAVARGLLLALPVVLVLASLLSEADPIFGQQIERVFRFLAIERLGEYVFRLSYILVGTYFLAGIYLFALLRSQDERVSSDEPAWFSGLLGWIEASILLGSVNLLFAFFVIVQARYFFGGQSNIVLEGFTYSEYARRGFGELVIVAFLSLALFFVLGRITRRPENWSKRLFSISGVVLLALVGVILVSAYQRLALYEAAYGFSRLRTYTHVFMIWLGLLLLAIVILETSGRLRYFALAAILAAMGFGASLAILNVDAFILRQNVGRAVQSLSEPADGQVGLDAGYLNTLSLDLVSAMLHLYDDSGIPQGIRVELGSVLACQAAFLVAHRQRNTESWASMNWSRLEAVRLIEAHQEILSSYPVHQKEDGWYVTVQGKVRPCRSTNDWD